MRSQSPRTVALLVETSNEYARGLLRGVIAYIREHQPWSIYLAEHGRGDEPPDWLAHWKGDGILARIENRRIADAVVASGLPTVDLSAANLFPGIPWVETDDRLIARAAFDHLYERGLRRFAFYGDQKFNWSNWRMESFRLLAAEAGCPCELLDVSHDSPISEPPPIEAPARSKPRIKGDPGVYKRPSSEEWAVQMGRAVRWVQSLEKPVGIMACFDPLGRQILQACRAAGVEVPDEAAVVGVDDDELLCELAEPPLSSVAPDTHRTGYEAAMLLDRLMNGEVVEPRAHFIEPIGIAVRKSSDMLAIDDKDISTAVRYIRENACKGISVGDILKLVPLSRRVMEARFGKLVGRSPHEEIERVRLNRVQELLRQTDLSLAAIAAKTGFAHEEYLSVLFKKRIGVPPSAYRRRHALR